MINTRQNFSLSNLVPIMTTGLVSGILEIPIEISFAALIFTGVLAPYLSLGIGFMLMGAIILGLTSSLFGSFRGSISLPQDTSAVIISALAAGIAASISEAPPETIFLTVLAAITVTSVLTGMSFLALGWLRLGNFVRYIPYPVIGGFLAGTGLLLLLGGLGVAAGISVNINMLPSLFEMTTIIRWLPALVFAIAVLIAIRRSSNPLVIPLMILGCIGIFLAYLWISGSSIQEASGQGLLIGPFPAGNLWHLPPLTSLARVDWPLVFVQIGQIITLIIISTISLLLNAGGLELVTKQEIDLYRELRACGIGNLANGFVGSIPGYLALSISSLSYRMGAKSRIVGVFTAGTLLIAMLFGAPLIALFPRITAGGLIAFLGLSFLIEWVYDAWFKLSHTDYLVVIFIMGVMGIISPLVGVSLGLVLAATLFIIQYSRVRIVKHTLNGKTYQSKVERLPSDRAILKQSGDWIEILELQGYLFFGTTQKLLDQVHARLHERTKIPPQFILLDFRQVTGMDASAIMSFVKLRTIIQSHPITIVFTHLKPSYESLVDRELRSYGGNICWAFFPDLDHGVEWCENQILQMAHAELESIEESETPPGGVIELLATISGDSIESTEDRFPVDHLLTYLERIEYPAGFTLIRQGDPPQGIFLVESGLITAQLVQPNGSSLRLRTMGPGTVVGELGLYLNIPATANVVTDQPSVVYKLSSDGFRQMDEQDPRLASAFHKFIARLVGDRLRDTLATIRALSE